jgi:hypothetical protein
MSFSKHLNKYELQKGQRVWPYERICLGVGMMSLNIYTEFFVFRIHCSQASELSRNIKEGGEDKSNMRLSQVYVAGKIEYYGSVKFLGNVFT